MNYHLENNDQFYQKYISDNIYKNKYIKYKEKYLKLKSEYEQTGGAKPLGNILKGINLFTDPDMEQYLNPIYGAIMSESGYIKNNFYLYQAGLSNSEESIIISKVTREIPGSIQPIKEIMQKIKPDEIGKYAGLLYVYKSQWYKDLNAKSIALNKKNTSKTVNEEDVEDKKKSIAEFKAIQQLIKQLNNSNKENIFGIKPGTDNKEHFYILLYCLWWVASDKFGIEKYYEGINKLFATVNNYSPNQFPLIIIPEDFSLIEFNKEEMEGSINEPSFELIISLFTTSSFHIYIEDGTKSYCSDPAKLTYADCGETTIRNLFNLIAYNPSTNRFDVDVLEKLGATKELVEFYNVFYTFGLQSSSKTKRIYDEDLRAKDAWSKLIIFYANKNVKYLRKCSTGVSFELNSGMALDGSKSNLLQVVSNLLTNITVLNDISSKENNIKQIKDETVNGLGKIIIDHKNYGEIYIECYHGHYQMIVRKKKIKIKSTDLLTNEQLKYYNIFINMDLNEFNYLWYNISDNDLIKLLNKLQDVNFKNKLLKLSLTTQYSPNTRELININTEELDLTPLSKSKLSDQYIYKSKNFDFVKDLFYLASLNSIIDNTILTIDLSPLCKINTIKNNFLSKCENLKSIDLTPLGSVTTIGNEFISRCKNLESINLQLESVTKIGSMFLYGCESIKSINLKSLKQLTSIGEYFLSSCNVLTTIDLSSLNHLTSIGKSFLSSCNGLSSIDLSPLNQVKEIKSSFLSNCSNLENVYFSQANNLGLSNLKIIRDAFMFRCKSLKSIDLSTLTSVSIIENDFMYECINLKELNLTTLKNLEYIRDRLAVNCKELELVNLSGLDKLKSIGKQFLYNSFCLTEIKLDRLTNLTTIDEFFLNNCTSLLKLDLTGCSNLVNIKSNLLKGGHPDVKIICTEKQKPIVLQNNPKLADKIIIFEI